MTGNEAVARGAYEAGVRFASADLERYFLLINGGILFFHCFYIASDNGPEFFFCPGGVRRVLPQFFRTLIEK